MNFMCQRKCYLWPIKVTYLIWEVYDLLHCSSVTLYKVIVWMTFLYENLIELLSNKQYQTHPPSATHCICKPLCNTSFQCKWHNTFFQCIIIWHYDVFWADNIVYTIFFEIRTVLCTHSMCAKVCVRMYFIF